MSSVVDIRSKKRALKFIDAGKIAEPLPDVPYLVNALGIAPGAVTIVAGPGFAGKTVTLQDMAVSIAAGLPVWGVYNAKRGAVAHLDFEQGDRISRERLQRIAKAKGLDLASLPIRLCVHPEIGLQERDALDVYTRALEGTMFAIVDSLRAAASTADENSSEVRRFIDLLNQVSERTGSTISLIHHTRKPQGDGGTFGKNDMRGSGAIFDAAASVFMLGGEKGKSRVTHEKCRNRGILVEPFGLAVEDVEVDGNPRGGLRVRHLEAAQLTPTKAEDDYSGASKRILEHLGSNGEFRGAKGALIKRLHMGNSNGFAAFSELESTGALLISRDERGQFIRLTDGASDAP